MNKESLGLVITANLLEKHTGKPETTRRDAIADLLINVCEGEIEFRKNDDGIRELMSSRLG